MYSDFYSVLLVSANSHEKSIRVNGEHLSWSRISCEIISICGISNIQMTYYLTGGLDLEGND
jgi:hypothetical protein